jgi:hypothetical protein
MLIDNINEELKERLHSNTLEILQKTKEPRYAYVAVQVPKRKLGANKEMSIVGGLAIVNVEDQPSQVYILNDLTQNRNGIILCYGNFPTVNNSDSKKQEKYRHYSDPQGVNPWDSLKTYCDNYIFGTVRQALEVKGYKKQLEEAQKKIEEMSKKGAKNERPDKETNRKDAGSES